MESLFSSTGVQLLKAAVTNALEGREFPFVFGGDGASFAVSPDDLERARAALAATATWVKDDLNLMMRVALVPVAAVRAQGLDVLFLWPQWADGRPKLLQDRLLGGADLELLFVQDVHESLGGS